MWPTEMRNLLREDQCERHGLDVGSYQVKEQTWNHLGLLCCIANRH